MPRNLTPQQVVLLLGTGLVIAGVLLFVIYTLHKALRRQRAEMEFKPSATKMNDSAFMIASMQGIVTKMKARETELESRCVRPNNARKPAPECWKPWCVRCRPGW